MQYWSTPKKLIALFGVVGVIALALLLIVKPMLSSETVTTNPESTVDSTIDPSADLQKPTEEVKLADVDAENFSESQEVYFAYLAQISQSVGNFAKSSTELSALSAKIAKDPSDKSNKKESDALAKKLKQEADLLIALEVDVAVKKAHDIVVTEAKNIILASEAIVANFGDYEEYEKALKQFGQAFEKIANIQGDYLAKIEKTTPQSTKVASNDPNIDNAPVE